jgi:hypothetical protein
LRLTVVNSSHVPLNVGVEAERRQVDGLLQLAATLMTAVWIEPGVLMYSFRTLPLMIRVLGSSWQQRRDAEQRLAVARAVAAGHDAAVVADHAVVARATGNPVVAVAADDVVVLAVAVQDVIALHAVDDVVARFAMDLVGGADVVAAASLMSMPPSV